MQKTMRQNRKQSNPGERSLYRAARVTWRLFLFEISMLTIKTQRLILIAATAELARADIVDRSTFSKLLNAQVPSSWPIEVMKDAQEPFAQALERGATTPGWGMWYIISAMTLYGTVGCYGQPDADGVVTIGYGIVPEAENKGIASEALAGLIGWLQATGKARMLRATTFEFHHPSIRVLEKNGFKCIGVSTDDALASEADRQGRGRLMIWERGV